MILILKWLYIIVKWFVSLLVVMSFYISLYAAQKLWVYNIKGYSYNQYELQTSDIAMFPLSLMGLLMILFIPYLARKVSEAYVNRIEVVQWLKDN